jgi:uncharacterized membrane protein
MQLPLTTIAQGDGSRIADPRRMVARSEEEWRALWALHAGPDSAAPAIDLSRSTVAAVFAGEQPSAGYRVEIARAEQEAGGRVRLFVDAQAPSASMVSATIITSPFHIVSIPRVNVDVAWGDGGGRRTEDGGRRTEGGIAPTSNLQPPTSNVEPPTSNLPPPTSDLPPPTSRSSTGLDPRTASALAYLAGPFSGALILFAETVNQDVRFHAWQSIVALGGLALAVIASYILAFMSLFVSAAGVSVMFAVATVIWVVLVVVWLICLWKAFAGERWKLPLAGDYAERLARRTVADRRLPTADRGIVD